MPKSKYLASLTDEKRSDLHRRLWERQGQVCFICEDEIDLQLHDGDLDVDHIDPLAADGLDAENNFALTHSSCNRSKGASNLEIARRMSKFERLQEEARSAGKRGANLGDLLATYGGSTASLRLRQELDSVKFTLKEAGDDAVREIPVHRDGLSGMESFFAELPIQYLHHDDRINPRTIGANLRGLIEEFQKGRPQLHAALAWWAPEPEEDSLGRVQVFDGQHKAAAQILLGTRSLPVRVFLNPNTEILRQANTNAGSKLKQVAFDAAVMHHLGSSLYADRVAQFKEMRHLGEDVFSFSETELVGFFGGEKREMLKYILDAQKDAIIRDENNRLTEFVEWAGKGAALPLSYSAIDRTFFKEFLYKKPLRTDLDDGLEQGENPRQLERDQLVRLMTMYAEAVFVDKWDPDIGGRQIENRVQKGEAIAHAHLRAWRLGREEVLANVLSQGIRVVMEHYYALRGKNVARDRLLHTRAPDELWDNVRNFLASLVALPCWVDSQLSGTVFGSKQNLDFWYQVFDTGRAPNGIPVLAQRLDVIEMIKAPSVDLE